jgi:hypothetical protein
LSHPIDERNTTHGKTIISYGASVEEQAMGLVILDEISRRPTGKERLILEQRLEGYYQREIAENLRLRDRYAVRRSMRQIRETAIQYLEG